jgi:hypothetical protein
LILPHPGGPGFQKLGFLEKKPASARVSEIAPAAGAMVTADSAEGGGHGELHHAVTPLKHEGRASRKMRDAQSPAQQRLATVDRFV